MWKKMSPFHFSAAQLQLELACVPTPPKHSNGEDGDDFDDAYVGEYQRWPLLFVYFILCFKRIILWPL